MSISENSTLLFIGDTITAAGRSDTGNPIPFAPPLGLGFGYVNLVNAWLETQRPELRIRVINRGVDGNTVVDLRERWTRDVLEHRPNWLSILTGISDVWRHFDTPLKTESHVDPARFESILRELIEKTIAKLDGLILMAPYCVEKNPADEMRRKMDTYGNTVRTLAEEYKAIFVDTQAGFDRLLEHRHPVAIARDRIHPGTAGHLVNAKAFLSALGFD